MTATATMSDRLGKRLREVWEYLTEEEQAEYLEAAPFLAGGDVPNDWRERIPLTFPRAVTAPFASRHAELWDWANAIEPGTRPRPFCAFWPRGGGKTSTAEMLTADLGCRGKRKYVWYVRMTQEKANETVQNIAIRFESPEIAKFYPLHAQRQVGKYGHSRGWRRNRLWTAGGFVVDALGLDTAARGSKVEDQRPDLIVIDDFDDLQDGPAATAKKIETLTKSIFPAGAPDCGVLAIQNLIIPDGIATQLADGRADFLADRIVSGPHPAVEGLKWEWQEEKETGSRTPVITAGSATWEGQPIGTCQQQMRTWGPIAFEKEAQHQVKGRIHGVALNFVPRSAPQGNYVDITDDEVRRMVRKGEVRAFGGVDFQLWRFGFTLWFINRFGIVTRIDELFSQRESLSTRAEKIDDMVVNAGFDDPSAKVCPIWGDSANPTDIFELNLAFKKLGSKLRVIGVGREAKLRKTAVSRMNDALDKRTLLFRRSVGSDHHWMLGANAGSEGTPMRCSRLIWEIEHWSFPVPKAGEPQDQNPDDDTADGGDLIASARYGLMSYWKPALAPAKPETAVPGDQADSYDFERKQVRKRNERVIDDLMDTPQRQTPAIDLPRIEVGSW